MLKKAALFIGGIFLLVAVLIGAYVAYLQVHYYRIPDHKTVPVGNDPDAQVQLNHTYRLTTYNIGFGAYGPEYSFFMDREIDRKTHEISHGKYGKGISLANVERNLSRSLKLLKEASSDFYTLQEVDVRAQRSYNIDEKDYFIRGLPGYGHTFALNFHSPYLAYPFPDMHGAVEAGLLTFSKYHIASAERRSFPIDESFINKFMELDRSFVVNRLPLENGKDFVLVNQHMSAYDETGEVRRQQMALLNTFLKGEKNKGNYVIVAGDFNHDYCNSRFRFSKDLATPPWIMALSDQDLEPGYRFIVPENAEETGSCRVAASPYVKGHSFQSIIDGFILSDNITGTSRIVPAEYAGSDHNPVTLTFALKAQ